MTKQQIENKLKELQEQLNTISINFHRVSGAIALLQDILKEETKEDGTYNK